MPIIPKKGHGMRVLRRPEARYRNITYTKHRATPVLAKRDMKRPAGVFDVLRPMAGKNLRSVLHRHGLLPSRTKCPSCGGKVGAGAFDAELGTYKYRCRAWKCHRRIERLHGHPVFA